MVEAKIFTESFLWELNKVVSSWNADSERYFFPDSDGKWIAATRKQKHHLSKKQCEESILRLRHIVLENTENKAFRKHILAQKALYDRVCLIYSLAQAFADKELWSMCISHEIEKTEYK